VLEQLLWRGWGGENPILLSALVFDGLLAFMNTGAVGGWRQVGNKAQMLIHSRLTFNSSCSKHDWKLHWIFLPP
jgi:hypothetical protein